jgi:hypothetical protein
MFHNLLTKEQKKALRMEYIIRLGAVSTFAVAAGVLAGIAALFPAYIGLRTDLGILIDEAARFEAESAEEVARPFDMLTNTQSLVMRLDSVVRAEAVSGMIADVFMLRSAGIAITAFSYERDSSRISIEGTAETREALVGYVRAVREAPYFSDVTDPISDLARSTDLSFRLQFTAAPKRDE